MLPEKHFSPNPAALYVLVSLVLLMICVPGKAWIYPQTLNEHEFYLLQYYKEIYSEEIFDYCIDRHGVKGPTLRRCLIRNDKLKQQILKLAQEQLGQQSLAQSIYDECLDYYPMEGVGRIDRCVNTRLELARKLEDEIIQKEIYKRCDSKWRKHGADAIDTCSRVGSTYFREKGVLRD